MNTLQMIKTQIKKASALHDAQIAHTTYRGIEYQVCKWTPRETERTYCYRGHTYTK